MTIYFKPKRFVTKNVPSLMLSCLLISIFSCSDDKTNANGSGQPYDPNTPVKLETFYPDSGGMATKVIIKGTNFGTDPEAIKVYYNTKKAAVVRAAGDMLYVITPRQPGAECQISVAIGKDSLTFENTFSYTTQTTVSTIAGKPVGGDDGHGEMIDGTLAEASFDQPWFLCVDAEKNIFVSERLGHAVRQINEEKNVVSTLVKGSGNCPYPNASATDAEGKTVFVALDQGSQVLIEFDPETQWAPKRIKPRPKEGTPAFTLDWMHSVAPNVNDGLIYTRAYNGQLVRFDPRTKSAEQLDEGLLSSSDSFVSFDTLEPDMLYICYSAKHCIYSYNIKTKKHELYAGVQNETGWQDGEREDALFNDPKQICFDQDGVMYVADAGNHVIRKITRDGAVSTVIGIAGVKGYVDGSPEDALFQYPTGVAIDKEGTIYVGDARNNCVRKLAIE